MNSILEIDFKERNAKHDFVKSLSETGFAVIKNHDIDKNLISRVYEDWKVLDAHEVAQARAGAPREKEITVGSMLGVMDGA